MTQYFESPFRVELVAADGTTRLGIIRSVSSLNTTDVLDGTGSATITFPANDEIGSQVNAGSQFALFDEKDGSLGVFLFAHSNLAESQGIATMRVSLTSVQIELARHSTGWRKYSYHDVSQVCNEIVAGIAPGWSTDCDAGMGFTAVDYSGESVAAALDELRKRFDKHFRLAAGFDRRLEFGAFGADSGVRLTGGDAVPNVWQDSFPNVVKVDTLTRKEEGAEIINRVIALSSGQGDAQGTLELSTYAGTYAVQSRANPDGSLIYFIEDAASILAYGVREQAVVFSNVRPLENSAAGKERCANELHAAAESFLTLHKSPIVAYDVTTINAPGTLQVGDYIRLVYRGVTDGTNYLDVDEFFFVNEITRNRDASGKRSQRLTISSTGQLPMTDKQLMVQALMSATAAKLHRQPYPMWSESSGFDFVIKRMAGAPYGDKRAKFLLRVDANITKVSQVLLWFQTRPLFTLAFAYWNGANVINAFGPVENTGLYPVYIELWIDGVNVSAAVGGPWNDALNTALQVTEEIDITTYCEAYGTHEIEFSCAGAAVFNVAFPGEVAIDNNLYSHGLVYTSIKLLGVAQAEVSEV
jgi:hypothetical protein